MSSLMESSVAPVVPLWQRPDHFGQLYRMAYAGEWDGYDRAWHASYAKDRRELDALTRGAVAAREEIKAEEQA